MTDTVTTEESAAPADVLGGAEIALAIKALSPDDRLKLHRIAGGRANGTGMTAQNLVHETLCRALIGQRRCPRKVPLMAFLVETMRSISSHARDKNRTRRSREDTQDGVDPVMLAEEKSRMPLSPEGEAIRGEEDSLRSEMVKDFFESLKDDQEAQLVLLGWSENLRGAKLREFVGIDQPALDYAAKRIRRQRDKFFGKGSRP